MMVMMDMMPASQMKPVEVSRGSDARYADSLANQGVDTGQTLIVDTEM